LTGYGKDVLDFVAFREQVLDVKSLESSDRTGKWAIEILDLDQKFKKVKIFDAVTVANDRYNDPYFPQISGLEEWQKYLGSISYSGSYRSEEVFRNKVYNSCDYLQTHLGRPF
jgi:cation diffusion facilitator CzcD-associated flavoprotein CzcO